MYANFRELFYAWFNVDVPGLAVINSFGFFVAVAFVVAAWLLKKELMRKEADGLLYTTTRKVVIGKPASVFSIVSAGLLGFIVGYKLLGLMLDVDLSEQTPQQFLLSAQGNFFGGGFLGGIFAYFTWKDADKRKLPQPKEEIQVVHPYELVGNITVIAAVAGIVGAKIFHHLENWGDFIKDPIGQLTDLFSGLTFYGGLILATVCVLWYVRKNGIKPIHMFDAAAPTLIIAYGIGRIGCMVAGDGDWGIINSAYVIDDQRNYHVVPPDSAKQNVTTYYSVYKEEMIDGRLHYAYFERPKALSFLPESFFAYDFKGNVLNQGIPAKNCNRDHCNKLPLPVFPTAFYETIMALCIFGVLWGMRKRIKIPGMLFCIYLMLNGTERFFIEKIRVNTTMQLFGMTVTQAEVIATCLFLIGAAGAVYTYTRYKKLQTK